MKKIPSDNENNDKKKKAPNLIRKIRLRISILTGINIEAENYSAQEFNTITKNFKIGLVLFVIILALVLSDFFDNISSVLELVK